MYAYYRVVSPLYEPTELSELKSTSGRLFKTISYSLKYKKIDIFLSIFGGLGELSNLLDQEYCIKELMRLVSAVGCNQVT